MGQYMGRINVEGDLETHDEFWRLVAAVQPMVGGDLLVARDFAKGRLIDFFRLARKRFEEPEAFPAETGLVTMDDLKSARLEYMVEAGWAVPDGDGFQVKNARKHFAWLIASKTNGEKGGRPPKEKKPSPNPRVTHGVPPAPPVAPKPNLPSPSPSPSPGPSTNTKPLSEGAPGAPAVIAAYVEAFKGRYGPNTRPDLTGRVQGQIKTLLKDIPVERLCNLVQVYLQLEDRWFVTKCHDFGTFVENVGKIGVALDTGRSGPQGERSWQEIYAAMQQPQLAGGAGG